MCNFTQSFEMHKNCVLCIKNRELDDEQDFERKRVLTGVCADVEK